MGKIMGEMKDWECEEDLRAVARAKAVHGDPERMKAVKALAKKKPEEYKGRKEEAQAMIDLGQEGSEMATTYDVVEGTTIAEIKAAVAASIADGYSVSGGIAVCYQDDANAKGEKIRIYTQAMTKTT